MFRTKNGFGVPAGITLFIAAAAAVILGSAAVSAQTGNLSLEFKSVSISDTTVLRGKTAGFPNPVMSVVTVRDKQGRYVHGLADTTKWLTAGEYAQNGEMVDYIWRIILEYHRDNNGVPDDPNVKVMLPEYMVTEIPRVAGYGASVALAMDYSGSVDNLDVIEDAAKGFIRRISLDDQVAVIKITDSIMVYQTFTSDTAALMNAIDLPTPDRSGTALFQGIYTSLEQCVGQPGRRVVIVYSDGQDDKGGVTLTEIIQFALANDIAIYSIGIGSGADIDEQSLRTMAYSTGGTYSRANRSSELSTIYWLIYQDIQGYYAIAHTTTDKRTNGTWRTVDVTVRDGERTGRGTGDYYVPFMPRNISITKTAEAKQQAVTQGGTVQYTSAGDTVQYTICVKNHGPGTGEDIVITDQTGDSLTFAGFSTQPDDLNGNEAVWNVPLLMAGDSVTFSYSAKVSPVMPFEKTALYNSADVFEANDSDASDNSAQAVVYAAGSPDLTIRCIKPTGVPSPGYPLTFEAWVHNRGNANVDTVFYVHFFLEGSSEPFAIDTLYAAAAGDSVKAEGVWADPPRGNARIEAAADFPDDIAELIETNNTDTCSVFIGITDIDLRIEHVSFAESYGGLAGSFPGIIFTRARVYDQNSNYIPLLAARGRWAGISDAADMGGTVGDIWVSMEEFHTLDPSVPENSIVRESMHITEIDTADSVPYYVLHHASSDTIQNNTGRTVELGVQVNSLQDTDTGTFQSPDGPADAMVRQYIRTGDFTVSGTDTAWYVQPLDTVYWYIRASNAGHKPISQSSITHHLPRFCTLLSSSPAAARQDTVLQWDTGPLEIGQTAGITMSCIVDTVELAGSSRFMDVSVLSAPEDTILYNNSDTSYVVYQPLAGGDLCLTKTAAGDSFTVSGSDTLWLTGPGGTVTYTVRVANQGQLRCENVRITDVLPQYLSLDAFTGAAYSASGDTLTWYMASLDGNGAFKEYTYQCRVDSSMPPWDVWLVNSAAASSVSDTIYHNNTDQDSVLAVAPVIADPEIRAVPQVIEPGDSVQVEVMSPVDAARWDLAVTYEDGSSSTVYADDFISMTSLNANQWVSVQPDLYDTRMRTVLEEETIRITLYTKDQWDVEYSAWADVTVRSANQFFLDANKFIPDADGQLGMRFKLSSNRNAVIRVYDISGAYIATVFDGPALAGWNRTAWNGISSSGRNAGSGLYVAILVSGPYKKARKFILVR